jgi:hypothetical protein
MPPDPAPAPTPPPRPGDDPAFWALGRPATPALFVPPPALAALLACGAATPNDAALLVRLGAMGRALDTGLAVARAQWGGWCEMKVRGRPEEGAAAEWAGAPGKQRAPRETKPLVTESLVSISRTSRPALSLSPPATVRP